MAFLRIYLNNQLQQQIELTGDSLTVGRTENNDLVLNSPGISSHHATIRKTEKSHAIEDNGSTNGVYVNGTQVKQHELKYWDEIQIYNYILKYMASARAQNDVEPEAAIDGNANDMGTLAISIETLNDLRKLKEMKNEAQLQLLADDGSEKLYSLNKPLFTIGSASDCDLQTGGWMGAKLAAQIEKRQRDYYLAPAGRGKLTLNGNKVSEPTRLNNNDYIVIGSERMRFHLPQLAKAQQA